MSESKRVMSEKPLNAETPKRYLTSWITANKVFFDRNQGEIPDKEIDLSEWRLSIGGNVQTPLIYDYETLLRMPKAIVANTLECSGNSRSLLAQKASGNPWTVGGVGNAVWGGVWLKDLLEKTEIKADTHHVAFEGFDKPLGKAQIKFVRSIPMAKALSTTLLAYEMNGEPLPLRHGFPLRALALGWTGANCVKWLSTITLMREPYQGFFMDNVYRIFAKGQDPKTGVPVTEISLKSIITQPEGDAVFPVGDITILGAAYAGESTVAKVDISTDNGATWQTATFLGPDEPFAWRQWQYVFSVSQPGSYTVLSRATDTNGKEQPMQATWNTHGYGNNGVTEHGISFQVR
ncbi:sulfite oxidase [Desulfopila sp. IMCC35006]|uniref:sulfite oxidase n=1 Tax=Desulfopila sp. IMCC35006 TaxID=2569542 RepID=UPI00142EAC0F|nr:sulfite oxidase [Desulfopila sp. IMCC35006]